MKKLVSPFKLFKQEIRKDNAFRKKIEDKKIKKVMLGTMGQFCIVLFGLLIMYYSVIGYVVITIINLEPIVLIAVAFLILVIWAWTSFAKKFFIENKIKYLKKKNLYEQYKQASKHIK